jgi:metal-sulfur cluster biosynthetic enzyme
MSAAPLREEDVWHVLRHVIDPELDCDIVSLGLVYRVAVDRGRIEVTMTFTTAGCPMNEILPIAVKSVLEDFPGVIEATVSITWEPPWDFSRMSEAVRQKLGVPSDV